ncbi:MAG: YncE family protein [Micrococcaceae bacterium]
MDKHTTAPAVRLHLRQPTWSSRKIAALITAAIFAGGSVVTAAGPAFADTTTAPITAQQEQAETQTTTVTEFAVNSAENGVGAPPEGATATGATLTAPVQIEAGATEFTLSGTNWTRPDGSASGFMVQYNGGDLTPIEEASNESSNPDFAGTRGRAWALRDADAGGTFEFTVPVPTAANSSLEEDLQPGDSFTVQFLAGSVTNSGTGDWVRNPLVTITIAEPVEEETPEEETPETEAPETEAPETEAPETEAPEVAEGYTRHTYEDGAYIDVPNEWQRGASATISGANWFGTGEEPAPSVIALKLNRGAIEASELVDPDAPGEDVWAVIRADADGNFEAEVDFPTPANSSLNEDLAEGAEIEWNALTGSLGTNDRARGGSAGTSSVVGAVPNTSIDQPSQAICDFTFESRTIETGVANGYQMAMNNATQRAYFGDSAWRQEARDADGTISITREPTGKLVEFDTTTGEKIRDIDFTQLTHANGDSNDATAFEWDDFEGDSQTSMRNTFSPYGVAVDESNNTIITTVARQRSDEHGYGGGIVMFTADQDAPTDSDRIFAYPDGAPVLNGPRRVAVNSDTNRAYLHSLADGRFGGDGMSSYITVLDTNKRGIDAVVAQIEVPRTAEGAAIGAVDVEVDQVNNLIYVGTMGAGEGKLYVIDGNEIVESDANTTSREASFVQNTGLVTELDATVGLNARLTFDPINQIIYGNAWASPTADITKVDANPSSETYGTALGTIQTGPSNQTAVDPTRGLLYSANLGDQEVVVLDAGDLSVVGAVPTSGNALNMYIDDDGVVWVSNFADAGKAEIITPIAPEGQDCLIADPEPTDPEPTEPEPTDPEPTEPEPTDPEPTEPEPTEPEPTDPEPTEPEPTDPEPTDDGTDDDGEVTEASIELSASEVTAGDDVTATIAGFAAGEEVEFELRSTPVAVGTVTADEDGAAELTFTVPADTEAGEHTVNATQVVGEDTLEADAALTVVAAGSDGDDNVTGGNDNADRSGTSNGPGSSNGTLARTGASIGGLAALGGLLAAAGAGLMKRRRQH